MDYSETDSDEADIKYVINAGYIMDKDTSIWEDLWHHRHQNPSQTDLATKCNYVEKYNKKLKDYQDKVEKEHEATDKTLTELSDRKFQHVDEASHGDSDESEDEGEKRGGRFKSERQNIASITSNSSHLSKVPDTLGGRPKSYMNPHFKRRKSSSAARDGHQPQPLMHRPPLQPSKHQYEPTPPNQQYKHPMKFQHEDQASLRESDMSEDEGEKRGGRFKSERQNIVTITKSSNSSDIINTLDPPPFTSAARPKTYMNPHFKREKSSSAARNGHQPQPLMHRPPPPKYRHEPSPSRHQYEPTPPNHQYKNPMLDNHEIKSIKVSVPEIHQRWSLSNIRKSKSIETDQIVYNSISESEHSDDYPMLNKKLKGKDNQSKKENRPTEKAKVKIITRNSGKEMKRHTDNKQYECDVCDKRFNVRTNLQRHMGTHNGDKPFTCYVCDQGFCQNTNLQRHMRTHTGDKPYKCNICGKGFSQKNNLETHTRTHTDDAPYKCNVCGKGFSQNVNLQAHIRTHTGDVPYNCNVCDKSFSQKSNLQTHMRTHTGDAPYKCNECAKGFSVSNNLQTHMRTHTGDTRYTCNTCGKGFSQKGNLQRHQRLYAHLL